MVMTVSVTMTAKALSVKVHTKFLQKLALAKTASAVSTGFAAGSHIDVIVWLSGNGFEVC